MKKFFLSKKQSVSVVLSGLASILLVSGIVYSATTISTNVNTGGTLTVTGASTLTGAATLSSTLDVTGATTLTSAALSTTLSVSGLSSLTGFVSSASSTVTGRLEADGNLVSANGKVGAGTTTPATEISASGSATTTLYLSTSGTNKGSCIELVRSHDGSVFRLTVGTTTLSNYSTTVLQVEAGACK